jgi:type IV secretory pathway TraG/TraD family ATPase VirD4
LRQKGQQVVILNLFNIQTGRRPDLASQGYNCLAGFDVTHPDCYEILKSNSASMVLQRGGDHPHFDARAQALLTFGQYLVKWLEYDVKLLDKNGKSCRRTGTLADVAEVLWSPYKSEDENITSLHHITSSVMKWEDKPGEPSRRTIKLAAASFFNDIPSNEEIGGVLATAQGQLEPLISEAFHADISKHPEIEVTDCRTGKRIKVPFNFEYLRGNEIKGRKIDKPIAVFVIIPWRERSTHAIWTRLIIGRAIRELIKEDAKPRYRTLMIVNEAASLGKLDILNDALSAVRFAGLMICSIWQDMEQIRRNFGSLGNFLTNAGVIQSYRVNDKTTADEISWRLGIETAITTSRTVNAKASVGSGNQTRAAHGFNLMDPWKLVGLKKRETICFVPECTAMPLRLHTPPRLRGLDPFLER